MEEGSDGFPKLRKAVAKDRRISIEDEDMRHGRKSRSQKIDGYKRHVLKDLEMQMIRAVGVTRAVEHTLAHISQWQGDKARYIGLRKNLFDLRRMAVVHNLHVLARMSETHAGEISHLTTSQSA